MKRVADLVQRDRVRTDGWNGGGGSTRVWALVGHRVWISVRRVGDRILTRAREDSKR